MFTFKYIRVSLTSGMFAPDVARILECNDVHVFLQSLPPYPVILLYWFDATVCLPESKNFTCS